MTSKRVGMVFRGLAVMVLALGWSSLGYANQVTNGDMELGGGAGIPPTGWVAGGGRVGVSTDTPSGTGHSLEVYDNAGGYLNGAAYQGGIPVQAGNYRLSFSHKGDVLRWWLADSNYVGISADNLASSSGWTSYSADIAVPAGVTSAILYLYAVNPYSAVLVDDVVIISKPRTPAPIFSPGSPYISGPTTITVTSGMPGARIYYTTNNTIPTNGGVPHTSPVTVTVDNGMTLQAIAEADGYVSSTVVKVTYTIIAGTNVITNGDMELGGGQSTPPTSWQTERGVVGVSSDAPSGSGQSMMVKNNTAGELYAGAAGQVIGVPLEEGTAQLSFTYMGGVARWLLLDSSSNILGADNLTESGGWSTYSTQINIPAGVTSAILILYAVNPDTMVLFDNVILAITPRVKAPTFSPKSRYLSGSTAITISSATQGATIYYTTNGSIPTRAGILYSGPVTISGGTTLKAMAVKAGFPDSLVTSTTFARANLVTNGDMELGGTASTPPNSWEILRGEAGVSTDTPSGLGHSVMIYNNTAEESYAGAISQVIAVPIEAGIAQLSFFYMGGEVRWILQEYPWGNTISAGNLPASGGWSDYVTQVNIPSGISSAFLILYSITPDTRVVIDDVGLGNLYPATGVPVFSPAGPYISGPTQVTISCATTGASIYYTTNGSTPTTASTPYTGPVPVTDGTTLKAMAVANGYGETQTIMTYTVSTLPIAAWYGNPSELSSLEVFRTMRECGFTHNFVFWGGRPALDAALEAGIRLFLVPTTEPFGIFVDEYKDHPALEAWYIKDEPQVSEFPLLVQMVAEVESHDNTRWCWINLNPIGGVPGDYQTYVNSFLNTVPVKTFGFDIYPIDADDDVDPRFYQNLEIISTAARTKGIPFWAFARSVSWGNLCIPTLTHLRYQMFSNLAYGAQGLLYYSYWQLTDRPGYIHYDAPIKINGEKSNTWNVVQSMNQEIKGLSPVFKGAQVVRLGHTGSTIPTGTTRYTAAAPILGLTTTGSKGAVVSEMTNGNNKYLVVVNRDILSTMTLTLSVDSASHLSKVSKDGTVTALTSGTVQYTVDPADIVILKWSTVTIIPGDANHDNKVDVSDLGILAANYGGTGKSWEQGDFNGDGKVDVSDLGILAANYGRGTGAVLDFNKDAKALGLVAGDDPSPPTTAKEDTPPTSPWGCGSAGLPLVAGIVLGILCLAGLKLKE